MVPWSAFLSSGLIDELGEPVEVLVGELDIGFAQQRGDNQAADKPAERSTGKAGHDQRRPQALRRVVAAQRCSAREGAAEADPGEKTPQAQRSDRARDGG